MNLDSPLLAFEDVEHRFARRRALDTVSFSLDAGQVVVVFGANGAGKTTLIRIAATLLAPTSGRLLFRGRPVAGAHRDRLRQSLGLVGHAGFLYNDLSARENLELHARLLDVPAATERAATLLRRMDLWDRREHAVAQFSRGMRQRLSLARALLAQPALLLMDEPFSGLDESGIEVLADLLAEARDGSQAAILFSTHDLALGLAQAQRFMLLQHGRVVARGRCAALRGLPSQQITLGALREHAE